MATQNAKKKIIQEEKTIELQTLEITKPRRADDDTGLQEIVRPREPRQLREKTRPKIVLETIPARPKQVVAETAPSFQEEESTPEVTRAVTSFFTLSEGAEDERIEWKVALIFSGLAVIAAVLFDLI
jgi:hypothetical protein